MRDLVQNLPAERRQVALESIWRRVFIQDECVASSRSVLLLIDCGQLTMRLRSQLGVAQVGCRRQRRGDGPGTAQHGLLRDTCGGLALRYVASAPR